MKIMTFASRIILLAIVFISIIGLYYLLENRINVVELAEMRYGYVVDFLIINFGVRITEYCLAVFFSGLATLCFLILLDIPKLLW
ncbi:MAG: hypothetical protein JW938_04435 [Candidatus Omnitrophica bacterium]|nr:hypothetical protein [Candidatus Omnitrophota bacterium]